MRLVGSRAVHHLAASGVAKHAAEYRHIQPGQMGLEFSQHRQGRQRAVCDDQGAPLALVQQVFGHQLARTSAKLDRSGERKTVDAHGGPVLNDFQIAFQFPVGHTIEPLTPFPLAGGGKMIYKGVA